MAQDQNSSMFSGYRDRLSGRGIMRTLFMPEIKLSFGTTGMTHRAFVSVLATMFIQAGLLAYNHPAKSMDTIGNYSLRRLMGEAWFNLRNSNKSDLQQYGLFFTVFLLFALAIMMVLTLGAQLFVSVAHAAGPSAGGLFSAVNPDTDMGLQLIHYLIGEAAAGEGGAQGAALGKLLSLYSYGVLVIASFIVAWSILSIVVDTAATGKFFGGRHNPVWWPIRLVFALGILIPLGHGFSAGQYMVIQIAKWGSNFASNGWTAYVDVLLSDGMEEYMANKFPSGKIGSDMYDIMRIALCKELSNHQLETIGQDSSSRFWIHDHIDTSATGSRAHHKIGQKRSLGNPLANKRKCGEIIVTKPTFGSTEGMFAGAMDSATYGENDWSFLRIVQQIVSNSNLDEQNFEITNGTYIGMLYAATPIARGFVEGISSAGDNFDAASLPTSIEPLVSQYMLFEDAMNSAIDEALTDTASFTQNAMDQVKARGWPVASLWYYIISSANAQIDAAVQNMPEVSYSNAKTYKRGRFLRGNAREVSPEEDEQARVLEAFNRWWSLRADEVAANATNGDRPTRVSFYGALADSADATGEPEVTTESSGEESVFASRSIATAMVFFRSSINDLSLDGSGPHPIVAMAEIGRGMIWLGTLSILVSFGTAASSAFAALAAGSTIVGGGSAIGFLALANLAAAASVVTSLVVAPLIIGGLILSIILPMTPFIRFVFAISGWLIAILEAVVMVPIIALGHLRTDGEGIMGPMLQSAYVMMLQLLLRPMLILIGLIMSMSLVSVTVGFVNEMFFDMLGTLPIGGGANPLNHLIRFVGFGVMYGVLMFGLINSSFKIVDLFPEAVVKYLGTGASGGIQDQEDGDFRGAIVASAVFASQSRPGVVTPNMQKGGGAQGDGNQNDPNKK